MDSMTDKIGQLLLPNCGALSQVECDRATISHGMMLVGNVQSVRWIAKT